MNVTIREGKIYANIKDLELWDKNPRSIKESDFKRLKKQLKQYGQYKPLLVTVDGVVIGGNMRLRAMREMTGFDEVWVSVIKTKDEAQMMEYALSDNDRAGFYDDELLANIMPTFDIDYSLFAVDMNSPINLKKILEDGGDGGGEGTEQLNRKKLTEEFIIPPFSVFDTRQGYWQDRKRMWAGIIKDEGQSREGALGMETIIESGNYKQTTMKTVSILDATLAEIIVRWFAPEHGKTFDAFAGDSVFGFVSSYLGRPFTGIELRAEQCAINQQRVDREKLPAKYICDDGQNVAKHFAPESQDLFFSCPPYFDLEVYSDLPNDASNQDSYEDFIKIIENAAKDAAKILKPNRFAVLVVSDIRSPKGDYYGFADDCKRIMKEQGLMLYNDIVLINVVGTAAIRSLRYFKGRKMARVHQNVLVFYKGDPKKIKENFTDLDLGEELEQLTETYANDDKPADADN
jgi:DNA modification methylase